MIRISTVFCLLCFALSGCYYFFTPKPKYAKTLSLHADLLRIDIEPLPNYHPEPYHQIVPDVNIPFLPILVRSTNISDLNFWLTGDNIANPVFEPAVNLGGHCGYNRGRPAVNEFNHELMPGETFIDTVLFLDCHNYSGPLAIRYGNPVKNEKGRIISVENGYVLSDTIMVNK